MGLYLNIEEVFSNGIIETEELLLNRIKNLDIKAEQIYTKKIKNRFIEAHGDASRKVVEYLLDYRK